MKIWCSRRATDCALRWLDFVALTVLALLICFLLSPLFSVASDWLAAQLSRFRLGYVISFSVVLLVLLEGTVIKIGAKRKQVDGITSQFLYPPTWLAGFLGAAVYSLPWTQELLIVDSTPVSIEPLLASAYFVAVLIIFFGTHTMRTWLAHLAKKSDSVHPTLRTESTKKAYNVLEWLSKEYPIASVDDDVLDHAPIARRIARLLCGAALPSIGILGEYGCGKSSIGRMVQQYLDKRDSLIMDSDIDESYLPFGGKFIQCNVEAWGVAHEDLPQLILAQILESLSLHMDTLAIRSLPQEYTKALGGAGGKWVESLFLLAGPRKEPHSILEKVDRLLCCIDRRLVVFIEDIERNSDQDSVRTQLLALLDRLKSLHSISFVLAIAKSAALTEDIIRVLEHVEPINAISPGKSLDIILRFRNATREEQEKPWERAHSEIEYDKFFGIRETVEESMTMAFNHEDPNSAIQHLSVLLSNPRVFKCAARRTYTAWQGLRGEVDFDELLVINALRSAAPEAYAFVFKYLASLRSATEQSIHSRNILAD